MENVENFFPVFRSSWVPLSAGLQRCAIVLVGKWRLVGGLTVVKICHPFKVVKESGTCIISTFTERSGWRVAWWHRFLHLVKP